MTNNRRYLFSIDSEVPVYDYDVIIVGSGIAGLYTALNLDPSLQCAIITKANFDESNSYLAQGGIAAVMNPKDTYVLHIDDTIKAGAGLSDPEAVKVLVEEGPKNIQALIDMKIPFDVNSEGDLHLTREGGHRAHRVVHAGGDATGKKTTMQLGRLALKKNNLHFFFESFLVDILTVADAATGVVVKSEDGYKVIRANSIVIATGGVGQVYKYTTNPVGAVGDGIAAALRAGAMVEDMEMIQFHPTTLISSGREGRLFLISEAVRGEGAILKNKSGVAFMQGKHEMADLAPRDVVTREILHELERSGESNVFLDVSNMTEEFFKNRFPTIYRECTKRGLNLTRDMIPVRPAQHYLMGGVKTDLFGKTNVRGLYCVGEAARTGIHGANRLASNSLLECLVFGKRCAEHINTNKQPSDTKDISPLLKSEVFDKKVSDAFFDDCQRTIKRLMTKYAGAIRNEEELQYAKKKLEEINAVLAKSRLEKSSEFKTYNMLQVATMIIEGAIARKTSVGAHYIKNNL